ncbi:MAG TPA: hypothetical protein VKE74_00055 [Gemmataceae bacterium]|nr:hypothetical protein [Gemmataceae bacterium]
MSRWIRVLAVAVAATVAGFAFADDKPKADPPATPLELTITGKTITYPLDTGGLSGTESRKKIEEAVKAGGKVPAPPAVDLVAEIKNTSDKPVKVWVKGDPVVLELTLKGEGAVNVNPKLFFTNELRLPEAVEIAPGKSHPIPVKSLASGFRGVARGSYWTEPGEYELVATLKTGVSPAPKGAKDGGDGFGIVTLTSAPLKIKVEGKK